jgi:hypothetical protein
VRYDRCVAHTLLRFLLTVLFAVGTVDGYEPVLGLRAIDEAIAIGQSQNDSARRRYHERYRLLVGRAPVDYIDVLTPFRRIVMAAEERAVAGNRVFSERDALTILTERPEPIELFVELTFHPMNTYLGVPGFDLALLPVGTAARVQPYELLRVPRYGARLEGQRYAYFVAPNPPVGGQPMLGGTLIGRFHARSVETAGIYDVLITEGEKELARARLNLGMLQ